MTSKEKSTLSQAAQPIVLHISGPDRPGITSTLTEILASEKARLIDIGQSVLHHFLILSAIIEIPQGSDALRRLLFAVNDLGLKLEVSTLAKRNLLPKNESEETLCLTLLGSLEGGNAIAQASAFLAQKKINIRDIKTLSDQELRGLELILDVPNASFDMRELRASLLSLSSTLGVDVAIQKDDIFRRNKRLICMDVDSTFVQMEVIDELARLAGTQDKVAAITERAMRGEIDFKEALRERVGLLKGLSFSRAKELLENIPLMPGAEELVKSLKYLGLKIGLVSGGFDFFVDALKKRFAIDFAFSNQLEVIDGKITGKVQGAIVDAERKAQILNDMIQVFHCHPAQTIAVGDGANDILMLQAAGLGIAFRAKPRLQAAADLSLNQASLDSILFLMGLRGQDLNAVKRH